MSNRPANPYADQLQVQISQWEEIEKKLDRTENGLHIKDDEDLLKVSESFYRLMKETRGQDDQLIKPRDVIQDLKSNPEESTKALLGHWWNPAKKRSAKSPKLIKKLNFRFDCLRVLSQRSGKPESFFKLEMLEGTSYLSRPKSSHSSLGSKISLANVLNGLTDRISAQYSLKDYFENYYGYFFRGDTSRPYQFYREADALMSETLDPFVGIGEASRLEVLNGGRVHLDLAWAFPRVTLARQYTHRFVALLCIDKKGSIPNHDFGYQGQNIGTGAAHSDTDFGSLTDATSALQQTDRFECVGVLAHSVREHNWVIVPTRGGECAGALEDRHGILFHQNIEPYTNQPLFQCKPDVSKQLIELPSNVTMRNFASRPFVELDGYPDNEVRRAKILPLPSEMIESYPSEWGDYEAAEEVQWSGGWVYEESEQKNFNDIPDPKYFYVNEDSLLHLQESLGPFDDYLGDKCFPVLERAGWHLDPISSPGIFRDVSNYGGDVETYTATGDAVEGYPIHTFLHRLENHLADKVRVKYGHRVVDFLNYDAKTKTTNFWERCRLLTHQLDKKREAILEGFSPESSLPREIKE